MVRGGVDDGGELVLRDSGTLVFWVCWRLFPVLVLGLCSCCVRVCLPSRVCEALYSVYSCLWGFTLVVFVLVGPVLLMFH